MLNNTRLQGYLERTLPLVFALTMFFIPISASMKSIFLVISVLYVLSIPFYRQRVAQAYFEWWNVGALVLFGLFLVSCLWSQAPVSDQFSELNKYSKLLYLPFLAVGFMNPKAREWGMNGFLMAMLLTLVFSILKAHGIISFHQDNDPGHIFHQHIITGFLMAYAGYASLIYAQKYWGKSISWLYLIMAGLFSYQVLFVNTGRTGYILYFVLVLLFCVQVFNLRKALIASLAALVLFGVAYKESAVLRVGVGYLISDYKNYQANKKDTSLGFRLQFHDYALSLLKTHPVLGLGTAGFRHDFAVNQPIPDWGPILLEPHSQYWLIATEQGIVGLLCYGLFLGLFLVSALMLSPIYRELMLGLVAIFAIASWSDSLLFYAGTGYLLVAMGGLLIGELLEKARTPAINQEDCSLDLKNLSKGLPNCN